MWRRTRPAVRREAEEAGGGGRLFGALRILQHVGGDTARTRLRMSDDEIGRPIGLDEKLLYDGAFGVARPTRQAAFFRLDPGGPVCTSLDHLSRLKERAAIRSSRPCGTIGMQRRLPLCLDTQRGCRRRHLPKVGKGRVKEDAVGLRCLRGLRHLINVCRRYLVVQGSKVTIDRYEYRRDLLLPYGVRYSS
jgi:hypothetical protein